MNHHLFYEKEEVAIATPAKGNTIFRSNEGGKGYLLYRGFEYNSERYSLFKIERILKPCRPFWFWGLRENDSDLVKKTFTSHELEITLGWEFPWLKVLAIPGFLTLIFVFLD